MAIIVKSYSTDIEEKINIIEHFKDTVSSILVDDIELYKKLRTLYPDYNTTYDSSLVVLWMMSEDDSLIILSDIYNLSSNFCTEISNYANVISIGDVVST